MKDMSVSQNARVSSIHRDDRGHLEDALSYQKKSTAIFGEHNKYKINVNYDPIRVVNMHRELIRNFKVKVEGGKYV